MCIQKWTAVFIAVLFLLVSGCSPQPAPASPSPAPTQVPVKAATTAPAQPPVQAPTKAVTQAPAKPTWQEDWDKTVAAAKKEGKVVIYTNIGADSRQMMSQKFKEEFGMDLEFMVATGSELAPKVEAERRAGLHIPDFYMSGTSTLVGILKPKGYLDSLDDKLMLPEVVDSKVWYGGKIPYSDKEQKYILLQFMYPSINLLVNSDLVKPGDADSYASLLDPKWKGKIGIQDPTIAGAGRTVFDGVGALIMGFDYWRAFVKTEPYVTRDRRLQVEWVAKEKHLITLGPSTPVVADFMRAGAPLRWVDAKEGNFISTTQAISLFKNAPHPQASKVFINWILTKKIATEMSKTMLLQSAREDVPTAHLDPTGVRKPGAKYFLTTTEDFLSKEQEYGKIAKEIFGPLLK